MKKLIMLFFIIGLQACAEEETEKKNIVFFQVKQFFQQQLNDIKKTPYYIYKIETIDGIKDSTSLPVDSIDYYAASFLESDINDPAIKKYYDESVFQDQTTASFTLSYASSNKDLPVQTINVLLREDGETVKRIFIRKYTSNSDSALIEQLSWKPGENFETNKLITYPGKKEKSQQVQIVWNSK